MSLSQLSVTTCLSAVDLGCEINVHGMVVQDGNLVHADRHGAAMIPAEAVNDLLSQVDLIVR
jgi:regulator of RNase E activity RraA